MKIGSYIRTLRKEKNLTQVELAEKLNISFQSISKWENDETLPDTHILLNLANELDTTVDTLLSGGQIINKKRKLIKAESIVEGFKYLEMIKLCFGEDSPFYKGIIMGISESMNFDFEKTYKTNKEVLYTEALINYLVNGYTVDIEEVKKWIGNEKYINEIRKRMH